MYTVTIITLKPDRIHAVRVTIFAKLSRSKTAISHSILIGIGFMCNGDSVICKLEPVRRLY